ncbi:phage holin family protein [Adhaeretor mobilis]|uniref:Uncharacterized protein n=1 Tax=Adhaeretor mobilis TaxID=1930276 RepID=A0A517MX77_9BACT|nr:phage holin family protein [Adhaeretor mobilis]QDS99473.1 hypothetical protein HG15A2_27960 [Adhaeretor mobilis]
MSASNGYHAKSRPQPHVRKSLGNLAHDAVELGEMQVQLLKLDTCEAGRKTRSSIVLALIGLTLSLASLPVAQFAIAEALIESGDWSRSGALGAAAIGTLAISLVFAAITWWKLRQGLGSWQRSNEEFSRNIAWFKSALRTNAESNPQGAELTAKRHETETLTSF